MSVSINPLSIEQIRELADKDGSLYIINYTDRGRQRNRGVFHLGGRLVAGRCNSLARSGGHGYYYSQRYLGCSSALKSGHHHIIR